MQVGTGKVSRDSFLILRPHLLSPKRSMLAVLHVTVGTHGLLCAFSSPSVKEERAPLCSCFRCSPPSDPHTPMHCTTGLWLFQCFALHWVSKLNFMSSHWFPREQLNISQASIVVVVFKALLVPNRFKTWLLLNRQKWKSR